MVLTQQWYPTDECVLYGAKSTEVFIWYFDEDCVKKAYGHTGVKSLPWVGWLDNGKKALSTNSHQTILWNVVDFRDPSKWSVIFKINEHFFPLFTYNR